MSRGCSRSAVKAAIRRVEQRELRARRNPQWWQRLRSSLAVRVPVMQYVEQISSLAVRVPVMQYVEQIRCW
eukprot:2938623-Prymnesium_polylepis.1